MHLLKQRALVFRLGLGQGIAQLDQRGGVVHLGTRAQRRSVELTQHDAQEGFFFGHDGRHGDGRRCWAMLWLFGLHGKVV